MVCRCSVHYMVVVYAIQLQCTLYCCSVRYVVVMYVLQLLCECIILPHIIYSYQKEYYNNKHSTVKILCNYSSLSIIFSAVEILWNLQHNNFPRVIIICPMVIILFLHTIIKFDNLIACFFFEIYNISINIVLVQNIFVINEIFLPL